MTRWAVERLGATRSSRVRLDTVLDGTVAGCVGFTAMSARTAILATAGILLLFGLGLLAGRALGNRSARAVAAPTGAEAAAAKADAAPSPLERERLHADALTKELQSLQAELASMKRPVEATALPAFQPLPFPEGLPEQFKPSGFESAMRAAFAACPNETAFLATDCSSYPCVAWARAHSPSFDGPPATLSDCPAWKERFPNVVLHMMSGTPDGEREERYVFFIPFPPGGDKAQNQPVIDAGARRIEERWFAMDP